MHTYDNRGARDAVFPDMENRTTDPLPEPGTETEAAPAPRWTPPEPLLALGRATGITALVTALGYAAYRWAATGLPMEPLPGSPWPYLTAWAVLTFVACLILNWATSGIDYDGRWQLIVFPAFAGVRLCLRLRPDTALVYAYGLGFLAVAAVAVAVWRWRWRRRLSATSSK
ncbi:hypothetical protein OOK31_19970 [Streptomyces sp. NBC_00249]|uniref:hypothetical protein n=1 Tax=Streptomyces sp. NBC_00249 TaxID=2975690 RepID=UPI0022509883|nr:hypothetical protein [Streptomyces sp. NBC_00249]MCX5196146.1 hypothetical protein [Streptomyces sp. NBC_00249]